MPATHSGRHRRQFSTSSNFLFFLRFSFIPQVYTLQKIFHRLVRKWTADAVQRSVESPCLPTVGIFLRRTGLGLNEPSRILCKSSSICFFSHGSASSTVIPSIPSTMVMFDLLVGSVRVFTVQIFFKLVVCTALTLLHTLNVPLYFDSDFNVTSY